MGQSNSNPLKPLSSHSSASTARCLRSTARLMVIDHTLDLPDECLALIFQFLRSGDRKNCADVCIRWCLLIYGGSRLSLDARAALVGAIPVIFDRFDSVTKLELKCDRRSDSIGDHALDVISSRCPNLTRLKLRACRQVTNVGMSAVACNCKNLKKLSCGSCTFGAKGIEAVLQGCALLEEISIKRLRGLNEAAGELVGPGAAAKSLRSVCLEDLHNGQCFSPMIAGSSNLKTLKLSRCSGDWDPLLEEIAEKARGIVEIHLEKLQVSDRGILALSNCSSVEALHLVKTPKCTDIGLSSVAEKCRLLRKLRIGGWKKNRIGRVGLAAVAMWCANLQELVLIGGNPTAQSLGPIAVNCENLESLAICRSKTFGDADISCIAPTCIALKELCIKGCPYVSDRGMKAIAEGFPNLMKVQVIKCREVTHGGADLLKASRETLAVVVQMEIQDPSLIEGGMMENGVGDQITGLAEQSAAIDIPSSPWKYMVGFM